MKQTSLLATNSYLKDRDSRVQFLRRTVLTSSAVEGVGKSAALPFLVQVFGFPFLVGFVGGVEFPFDGEVGRQ